MPESAPSELQSYRPSLGFVFALALLGFLVFFFLSAGTSWPTRPRRVPVMIAKVNAVQVGSAIQAFRAEYGDWPVTAEIARDTNADFTFGSFGTKSTCVVTNGNGREANNSEIVLILMATESGVTTGNLPGRDLRNPRKIAFLHAPIRENNGPGGVGIDGVFRDSWGNPYIITLDLNGNGWCEGGGFRTKGSVSVWSFGRDKKANPKEAADEGVNKDNIHFDK